MHDDDRRRRDAERSLARLTQESHGLTHGPGPGIVEEPPDAAEIWGRRIGRGLAIVVFIAICIYLWHTYLA